MQIQATAEKERSLEDFDRERGALKLAHEQHVAELERLHEGHLENEAGRSMGLVAAVENEAEAQQSVLEQCLLRPNISPISFRVELCVF